MSSEEPAQVAPMNVTGDTKLHQRDEPGVIILRLPATAKPKRARKKSRDPNAKPKYQMFVI